MRRAVVTLPLLVFLAAAGVGAGQGPAGSGGLTADFFKGIQVRTLGPSLTTGRVADIAVDPKSPDVYYVATGAGGLWKSENRGITFTPVFDEGGSFSMACVVIDPRNSNVVWLGTGENSNPRAAMFGDGVYKSTDAGKTWARVGLEKSEHIGNIKIDPRNSDVVYVAAQGPLWSGSGDRGVYKTTDGGKTWKAVLTVSPDTGANEVIIDPNNPDVLYASTWQRRRSVGQFIGGGPESAIHKSTNAGATWTKLANGLPKGDMGRITLGVDPKAKPTRVYALCNAKREESGFYRSDDAGATWARVGHTVAGGRGGGGFGGGGAAGRGGGDDWYRGGDPGYYHEIFVDPVRPDTIWSANTNLDRSEDGGKTWKQVPIDYSESTYGNVHVDFHAVWSDPTDRNHYMVGNDGGAYETYDDGKHFRHFDNLPVTQFYRVAVDNAKPFYKVCGGAQDNNSMCGPSRTVNRAGIRTSDWIITGGGDGFQSRVDPEDPNIIYATSQSGGITRLDLRTGVSKGIRPRSVPQGPGEQGPGTVFGEAQNPPVQGGQGAQGGAGGQGGRGGRGGGERVNWDCPYIISPHSATRLYWGSTRLYRTEDRGDHWTAISGDLTRNLDPTTIPIMGKVWPTDSVSYNQATTPLSTVVSIDESPVFEGLLYVGTDDGLLQVSEDGGKNWRKVDRFPGVPEGTYLTDVFASPRDANVVFVALNNWQKGDFKPYLLKSSDRGRTFTSIAGDLPDRHDVWSVVQDHINGELLFAGTEFGLFFTVDGGNHWVQLKGGLPTCQVRDLAIQKRENDLALGTFGRGFYILDDYSPLREVSTQAISQEAELFPLRTAYQYAEFGYERAAWGNEVTPNPPVGAVFTYSVGQELPADTKLVVTITDDTGKQVRRLDQLPMEGRQPGDTSQAPQLPKTIGIHRVVWNLRGDPIAPPAVPGGAGVAGGAQAGRGGGAAGGPPAGGGFGGRGGGAPAVEPGRYTATLGKLTGDTVTPIGKAQSFMVIPLPAKNW